MLLYIIILREGKFSTKDEYMIDFTVQLDNLLLFADRAQCKFSRLRELQQISPAIELWASNVNGCTSTALLDL